MQTAEKQGSGELKIAIPSAGGRVSAHFGRAERFVLLDVDPEGRRIVRMEEKVPPEHEPGVLPRWLEEMGVKVVITGGIGMMARRLLEEAGIRVVAGVPEEEPEKLVMEYLAGKLRDAEGGCSH